MEGCLDHELGFGVVEMSEELKHCIVLAKLVRKFKGEAGARRIYEVRICFYPTSSIERVLPGAETGFQAF
jgi:hypothetical protein